MAMRAPGVSLNSYFAASKGCSHYWYSPFGTDQTHDSPSPRRGSPDGSESSSAHRSASYEFIGLHFIFACSSPAKVNLSYASIIVQR
jgi:hypothetical protein